MHYKQRAMHETVDERARIYARSLKLAGPQGGNPGGGGRFEVFALVVLGGGLVGFAVGVLAAVLR